MAFLSFFLIFVFNIFRAESYILNKLRFPIFCGFFLDTCSPLSRFRASTNHGYISARVQRGFLARTKYLWHAQTTSVSYFNALTFFFFWGKKWLENSFSDKSLSHSGVRFSTSICHSKNVFFHKRKGNIFFETKLKHWAKIDYFSWCSTGGNLECFQDFLGLNIHFRTNNKPLSWWDPKKPEIQMASFWLALGKYSKSFQHDLVTSAFWEIFWKWNGACKLITNARNRY